MTSCTVGPDTVHYISAHNTRHALCSRPSNMIFNKNIYRTRQHVKPYRNNKSVFNLSLTESLGGLERGGGGGVARLHPPSL